MSIAACRCRCCQKNQETTKNYHKLLFKSPPPEKVDKHSPRIWARLKGDDFYSKEYGADAILDQHFDRVFPPYGEWTLYIPESEVKELERKIENYEVLIKQWQAMEKKHKELFEKILDPRFLRDLTKLTSSPGQNAAVYDIQNMVREAMK